MCKNMRKYSSLMLVLLGILFLSSCEKVVFEPPVVEGQVSFATEVAPPISADCGKCHAGMKSQVNFYEALAKGGYIDTVNTASSKIYQQLQNNAAHKGYTSAENLAKILKWFEQGAKNN